MRALQPHPFPPCLYGAFFSPPKLDEVPVVAVDARVAEAPPCVLYRPGCLVGREGACPRCLPLLQEVVVLLALQDRGVATRGRHAGVEGDARRSGTLQGRERWEEGGALGCMKQGRNHCQ